MAHDTELNQDLNSTKDAFSPAHQHLEPNSPGAIVSEEKKMDDMAMESARRGQNRVHKNEERIPTETIFTK